MAPLRLVFMGTPDFAVPALAALTEAGHEIVCIYTQPPRPAGRGHRERRSPVHDYADRNAIAVRCPATLKDEAAQAAFAALAADAAVVAAYGLILPRAILEAPRLGCLNIHASLLPRWRGAAPIQRAMLAGDDETGITIMQMDEGLDTGAMVAAEATPIGSADTAGALHDRLAEIGARLIVDSLAGLDEGRSRATPQPADGSTYARKLARDDGALDWRRPAAALERQVRALHPRPGAWFRHAGDRIQVHAAALEATASGGAPGTVLDDRLTVACGDGALRLAQVQRPGRAAMTAEAFLRGYALLPGTVLECPPGDAA